MDAKAVVAPLGRLWDCSPAEARAALREVLAEDATVRLCHPFETLDGPKALFERAIGPLYAAMPDLERRDWLEMAGTDANGQVWVGLGGEYCGVLEAPWLGVPPTFRAAAMRFHEFYRIEDGRAVEMQALWDIPELMMQAGAWPMSPSLGRDWRVTGPARRNGSAQGGGAGAGRIVMDMLEHLAKHAEEGPEAMRLGDFWHPRCSWYGPAGIGTARGVAGFRAHHQIPFLKAMPDRRALLGREAHFFAEGDLVGFTAWPGMEMTLTGDGWLGIAPAGQKLKMRSLDFWRVEDGLIRENWVLVDLLDVYAQLGVDVLERMKELTGRKAA